MNYSPFRMVEYFCCINFYVIIKALADYYIWGNKMDLTIGELIGQIVITVSITAISFLIGWFFVLKKLPSKVSKEIDEKLNNHLGKSGNLSNEHNNLSNEHNSLSKEHSDIKEQNKEILIKLKPLNEDLIRKESLKESNAKLIDNLSAVENKLNEYEQKQKEYIDSLTIQKEEIEKLKYQNEILKNELDVITKLEKEKNNIKL